MLAPVFCKFPSFCELQNFIIMTKEPAIGFFSDSNKSNKILISYYFSCRLSVILFATLTVRSILKSYVSVICSSHIVLFYTVYLTIRYNKR